MATRRKTAKSKRVQRAGKALSEKFYDKKISIKILNLHRQGMTLKEILSNKKNLNDDGRPKMLDLLRWIRRNTDSFRTRYAHAHEEYADSLMSQIVDIAEDGSNDWAIRYSKSGKEYPMLDHEHFQRSKLRIETRRMVAAHINPKKYGTKLDLSSNDGSFAKLFSRAVDEANDVVKKEDESVE